MSEPVSALNGATAGSEMLDINEIGPVGMISARGDLGSGGMAKAVKSAVGLAIPGQRELVIEGDCSVAWMSPDELLLMCPYAEVTDRLAAFTKASSDFHALAVNVSDARAMFSLSGAGVREALAKLAPVDMHPDQFKQGMIRRTRLAQVPAAFWLTDASEARLVCFRSVAGYVFDLVKGASADGSAVHHL